MPVSAYAPQLLSRQTTKHAEMILLSFVDFNLVELFLNDQNNRHEVSHNLPILASVFLDHLLFCLIILKIKAYKKLNGWLGSSSLVLRSSRPLGSPLLCV